MTETEGAWDGDTLGRKAEGQFLIDFVRAQREDAIALEKDFTLVLNLDADWGYGKSFLLEHLAKQLSAGGHVVAKIDAWASDFASDPLVPVMAALEQALQPHLARGETGSKWQAAKENVGPILMAAGGGLLRGLANKFLPGTADAVADLVQGDLGDQAESVIDDAVSEGARKAIDTLIDKFAQQALDEFRQTLASIANFRLDLAAVVALAGGERPMPMFVLIDELDRCRPSYAVAMLERIKHLFQIKDVVFIVATNTDQLKHSIRAVYGTGFDSERYLHRFFDLTYSLAEPQRNRFVLGLLESYPRLKDATVMPTVLVPEYLNAIYTAFDMSARDMAQCTSLLNAIISTWPNNERPIYPILIPLVCAQQLRLEFRTLADASVRLADRLRYDGWYGGAFLAQNNTQERVHILTMLKLAAGYVGNGVRSLAQSNPAFGREAWIASRLLEGTSGTKFSVEAYPQRVRQVGRLFTTAN
nr:P-loop NTPase fold protein [uncultured Devosia sp.]